MNNKTLNKATLVLFTMYYSEVNPQRLIRLADIDTLLEMAEKFENKYKELQGKNWENEKIGWEDTVINFYNENLPNNWNRI